MSWKVAEAKQRFSEVLRAAGAEPQKIFNRSRFVAAVVDGPTFEEFSRWKAQSEQRTLGDRMRELRELCSLEETAPLATVERQDRPNPWLETLDDAALRHQRSE